MGGPKDEEPPPPLRQLKLLVHTHLTDAVDHVSEEESSSADEQLHPPGLGAHIAAQQPNVILLGRTHRPPSLPL